MKKEQVLFKRGAEKNHLFSNLGTGRSPTHCQHGGNEGVRNDPREGFQLQIGMVHRAQHGWESSPGEKG